MINSNEHEISAAHKNENAEKNKDFFDFQTLSSIYHAD